VRQQHLTLPPFEKRKTIKVAWKEFISGSQVAKDQEKVIEEMDRLFYECRCISTFRKAPGRLRTTLSDIAEDREQRLELVAASGAESSWTMNAWPDLGLKINRSQ